MYTDEGWDKIRDCEDRINHMLQLMLGASGAKDWWFYDSWKFGCAPILYENIYELEDFVYEEYKQWRKNFERQKI